MNRLFLDFDNTMAHSLYANNETHADQLLYDYGEHWYGVKFRIGGDGWLVSFKRNWTDDLLNFSRNLVGNDNVYILTTGTLDYIRWCNVKLELGFDPNTNISGREDISYRDTHPKFIDSHNVLVDDLSYSDHASGTRGKVKFLNNISKDQYLQVQPFTVWSDGIEGEKEYFDLLKDRIVRALIKTEL